MSDSKRQFEAIKFTFSAQDTQELGQKLARETQNVYDLENRKKEMAADMKAQLDAANGRVAALALMLNNGYEMREVEVLVIYDEPSPGLKRIVRVDNNQHIRDEAMSDTEKQRGFGFPEPE